ncbi:MAG: polysaccharide biosynthesis/export family protein [Deltaproteobacteria bacterium]
MTQRSALSLCLVALLAVTLPACRAAGEYVKIDDYKVPEEAPNQEYVIRPGDVLQVRVMGQESVSVRAKVRPDGQISLPLLGDVLASGVTPSALARQIQERLTRFIVNPSVTISLEEPRAMMISVLGEVPKVGTYPLEQGSGIMEALAAAGGLTQYAASDRIIIIRREPSGNRVRIRFEYDALTQLRGAAATFRLQNGDVIVVD